MVGDEQQAARDQRMDEAHDPRETFARLVRDALSHIQDPAYLQTHPLAHYLQADSGARRPILGRALRQALLEAIEALHPGVEGGSNVARLSTILQLRFVDGLGPQEVQAKLALSRSHFYREHQTALAAVASVLAARWGVSGESRYADIPILGDSGAPDGVAVRLAEDVPHHGIPLQLTSFVGREREMAEVRRLLSTTRLLTLTGAGGCGKTRLAYQVAAELLATTPEECPDGVWVAELAALTEPDLVPQTVASALRLREQPGVPMLDTLVGYLEPRRLLLALDNCEHLLDASARLVERLLLSCSHLRVLATSREMLGASGEVVWRVPSLATPDPRDQPSLGRLAKYEAVCLFVERARLVQSSFQVTEQNASALAEICRRLDGIPLAIELAAALTRVLSPEQIASRLDHDFHLLTGGRRIALPRQQTLKAALDWSHDLLSSPERVLFRRLAVFAGGLSLEAAEAVCSGDGIEKLDLVDLLAQLVDKSLVEVDAREGDARYRLLEPVRQYAWHRLEESGEGPRARDRHVDWCLELAELGAPGLIGREQSAWLKWFEMEHDNLRVALACALARKAEPDAALRLGLALGAFWQRAQRSTEAREWLGRVLATSGGEPTARIRVLWLASEAEAHIGNHRKAVAWRQEGLELAHETGDKQLIALSSLHVSYYPFDIGDLTEARRLQDVALDLARESGDQRAIWEVLCHLSSTLLLLGDFESMRRVSEEGLSLSRTFGDREKVALLVTHLGYASLAGGDVSHARAQGKAGVSEAREADSVFVEVLALRLLGDVTRSEGDLDGAEGYYREMLEVWQRVTGNRLYVTSLLPSVAGLALARGQTERGLRILGAVEGWLEKMGMPVAWGAGPYYQQDEVAARSALGEPEFAPAWAEGQAMTLEEAVEYALR